MVGTMTFKKNALEYIIRSTTEVNRLIFLRDFGLDMILADPDIKNKDFNQSDKDNFIAKINARITELGGQ